MWAGGVGHEGSRGALQRDGGFRAVAGHVVHQGGEESLRLLVRHQPHAHLGLGEGRDDGLGPRARVAARDAVDLEGRLGPPASQNRDLLLDQQLLHPEPLAIGRQIEGHLSELLPLGIA